VMVVSWRAAPSRVPAQNHGSDFASIWSILDCEV
jgi:hypothetical protein